VTFNDTGIIEIIHVFLQIYMFLRALQARISENLLLLSLQLKGTIYPELSRSNSHT